ncbi:MAG: DUF2061 domain-containing protein [Alphaproteobacteria bacterium]|nr:DUF2061 domain-containing protein [Alphaproteobacteria bacterium]
MAFCRLRRLTALALLAVVLFAGPASAQERVPGVAVTETISPDPLPAWQRALYKAVTYQAMGNIADFLFYRALIGGSPAMTGSFVVVNAVTGFSLYYGYEYAWNSAVPPSEDRKARSLTEKTVLYRALNTSKNFALSYAYSGSAALASAFVASTFISDTAIFLTNEYLWGALRPRDPS